MNQIPRLLLLWILCLTGATSAAAFNDAERARVIEEYAQKLEDTYVFPAKGKWLAEGLRGHLKRGDYAGLDEKALADKVEQDLNAIVPDQHNGLVYVDFDALEEPPRRPASAMPVVPVARPGPDNFGFAKFEMKGNVAYLRVSRFGPVDQFSAAALAKVMSQAARSQAMIIDLREGQGGVPTMGTLLSSYFFEDQPIHLLDDLDRDGKITESFITTPQLALPRYGSKRPLYVLVDEETASASEAFAYGLQQQKRAMIVGQKTSGGAHKQFGVPVSHHLIAFVAIGRAVNPATQANWERTGVQPDIVVPADQALDAALARISKAAGAQ